jgi:hypothetical protein
MEQALLRVLALGFGMSIVLCHPARAETQVPAEPKAPFQIAQASLLPATLPSEKDVIHKAVSDYYEALSRSATEAATFYGEPTLLVLPNRVTVLSKRADVEESSLNYWLNIRIQR